MLQVIWTAVLGVPVVARLANVTIDDWYGDERTGRVPHYASGGEQWNAAKDTCTGCVAQPDGSQSYNYTWHDATTLPGQIAPNASFTFEGTALWIFCTLANAGTALLYLDTRLAFYLDDSPAQQFEHVPDGTEGFSYQRVVYQNENIPPGNHTMTLSSWATADSGSLVLFDYAVYTMDLADDIVTKAGNSTGSSTSTSLASQASSVATTETASPAVTDSIRGAVAGGIAASGIVFVVICGLIAWWYIVRRRRARVTHYRVPPELPPPQVDPSLRTRKLAQVFSEPASSKSAIV